MNNGPHWSSWLRTVSCEGKRVLSFPDRAMRSVETARIKKQRRKGTDFFML